MFVAELFVVAKTGRSPSVHQQVDRQVNFGTVYPHGGTLFGNKKGTNC